MHIVGFRLGLSGAQCHMLLFLMARMNDEPSSFWTEAEEIPYSNQVLTNLKRKGLVNKNGLTKRGVEYTNHFIESFDNLSDLVQRAKAGQKKFAKATA